MDKRTGAVIRLLSDADADHLAKRVDRPYADVLPFIVEARELTRKFHGLCAAHSYLTERWKADYNDGLLDIALRLLRDLKLLAPVLATAG